MQIKTLLKNAAARFKHFESAQLDADILLAHVLQVPRSTLYTWPEKTVTPEQQATFQALCDRRAQGEPIAYLTGHQEFWSLNFKVTPACLIPRADTETLVEVALSLQDQRAPCRVLDLGTGSGAIAIALAHTCPGWDITAVDRAPETLALAKENAERLHTSQITFLESDWFDALPAGQFDLIVSNPPYIDPADPHLRVPTLQYEPQAALVSEEAGLAALTQIIKRAPQFLRAGGVLALEHGATQGPDVRQRLEKAGFLQCRTYQDLNGNPRVSTGQIPQID